MNNQRDGATCEACAFWQKGVSIGECRRRAPAWHPRAGARTDEEPGPWKGYWPNVDPGDWCGEHQPRYVPRHPPASTTVDLEVAPPLAGLGLRVRDEAGVEHVLRPNAAGVIIVPFLCTIVGFE